MTEKTAIIPQSDVKTVLDMETALAKVEESFKLYGQKLVQMPPKVYLRFEKGDLRCMPAFFTGGEYAGVKNVNVHPANKHMPSVMALGVLNRTEDGFPAAIMDATYITALRTGAAGGIAAKYLSRTDARSAGFIGAGTQAKTQIEALFFVRPSITSVLIYDINKSKSLELCTFAKSCAANHGLNIDAEPSVSIEYVASNADILTTITPVRTPIIEYEWIKNGTHINAIGADAKGKHEICDALIKNSKLVVDDFEQASHSGEINVPISQHVIMPEDIHATIGEIVTGKKPGRTNNSEITIFDSTGLAIQDLALMIHVFTVYKEKPEMFKKAFQVDLFD